MTTAPFAAAMHMLNASVPAVLANATATYQGGTPFGVLFDRAPADLLGVATYAPECAFDIAHTPGLAKGSVLVIDGAAFAVAGNPEPDGSGWVRVQLREA